jgi:uncharacterized protein YbaP (TraB family)
VNRPHSERTAWAVRSRRAVTLLVSSIVAILTLPLQGATPSFLWKVAGPRGGTVYVAGSIHLLSNEYYPLAPAFDEAFEKSDLLVEEVDMAEMLAPEAQMQMLTRGMMPAGQTLESVVSPQTMTDVRSRVAGLGLPLAPLQLFKPWSLALTLQGLEWQKAGFDPELGLDRHFYDRAKEQNRPVQGLETLAFQISAFDDMPMPMQDHMLSETLKEMDTTRNAVDEMAGAWKAGDAPTIERLVLKDLKSEPQVYERLLLARNRNWLPKLEALFSRPKPSFVIVGAAHLVGSDGLLQMLRAKGYIVTQM